MKISIEVDEKIENDEVIIKCKRITDKIQKLQEALNKAVSEEEEIVFYKDDKEFYLSLEQILFFETEDNGISAHTINECYKVRYKLYELENILPKHFCRVSKSTILNVTHIYSISKNLTGSSLVEFQNTHKKVYISRYYYKTLKNYLGKR